MGHPYFVLGHRVFALVIGFLFVIGMPPAARAEELCLPELESFAVGDFPRAVATSDLNQDGIPDVVTANADSDDVSVLLGVRGGFEASDAYPTGDSPYFVSVSDLDRDRIPDLVTANEISNDVTVLIGSREGGFADARSYAVGLAPHHVVASDLDDDGVPDLVTANSGSDDLSILIGLRDGGYRPARSIPIGDSPESVAVADLNGDDLLDVVVANRGSDAVTILLNTEDAGLMPFGVFAVGRSPLSVVVADLNGDRIPDLVTANSRGSDVAVLLGVGDGSFQMPRFFVTGLAPQSVAVGDLNDDGVLDIMTATGRSADVTVLLGIGDGGFDAPRSFITGFTPRSEVASMSVSDMDGDGRIDVVTAHAFRDNVRVLRGTGDGNLDAPRSFQTGEWPESMFVSDMDGDGIQDVVTANSRTQDVSVLLGGGDGTFRPSLSFPAGISPHSVAVSDLNLDGIADVAVTNVHWRDSSISVLLGNGDGTLRAAKFFATGILPQSLVLADLNGDRLPDAVTGNVRTEDVSVLLGTGGGEFAAPRSIPTGDPTGQVIVSDLNGDTFPDVVAANGVVIGGRNLTLLLGVGDGSFAAPSSLSVGVRPVSITASDLDDDGIPDMVTATGWIGRSFLGVLMGTGNGEFDPIEFFSTTPEPPGFTGDALYVTTADLNGDDIPDLLAANDYLSAGTVRVLLGEGDGRFRAVREFESGASAVMVAAADLNADGTPDVISLGSNRVVVLLNACDAPLRPEVDIRPQSPLNLVQPMSRGKIPVAILGSDEFDVREIERVTLVFGPKGALPVRSPGGRLDDVDMDGTIDLVTFFDTAETGIAAGETEACIEGQMLDGTPFEGCDGIRTVPACGTGYEAALAVLPLVWAHERRRRASRALLLVSRLSSRR